MPIHGYPGGVITANPVAPTSTVASGVWTTEQQLIAKAAGNWPFTIPTQQIGSSLRFNPADSAYLNRTLGSSNRRTFTFSAWVKRSLITSNQFLFGCITTSGGVNQQFGISLQSNDTLNAFHFNSVDSTYFYNPTLAVFRDVSAWYHIVASIDTTQATNTNRCKLYVNGVEQVLDSPNYFSQNLQLFVNSGLNTGVGVQVGTGIGNSYYLGGYMAEVYFIDGQQLTPSSFGRTNTATGVWEPLAYTGTYGTNGFYLNFSDNSGATSTTLGKDTSGNGNNWTPNNFSVTAGAGNDSLVDSPTSYGTDTGVGGEVRGNYCTLNPLQNGGITLTNGNLDGTSASGWITTYATIGISTGKWYWEGTCTRSSANEALMGIVKAGATLSNYVGSDANGWCYYTSASSSLKINNASSSAYGATYTTGDVIGVALDLDAGTLVFYKNGVSQGTAYSSLSGVFFPAISVISNSAWVMNFGQRAFAYTAPSGFKALCTQNLPTPTIGATSTTQANDYFDVTLYTGTDATQSITNSGSMQPDFVWVKARNGAYNHYLYDVIRGSTNALRSSTTGAESQAGDSTLVLQSTGFQVTGTGLGLNSNGTTIVGWQWKGGGTGVSNTAGTITSTVSANTTSGFSISTYTGNGSSSQTVGHGLGVAPSMVIIKTRSNSDNWRVWHTSLTSGQTLTLNSTAGQAAAGFWPSSPSTSVVYLGTDTSVNSNTWTYVMYSFAPVAGYSAFGSYTGNGSTDGPFVYLGFRPEFVMWKRSDSTGSWYIQDMARNPYNQATNSLYPNLADAETSGDDMDYLSNGFKVRDTFSYINASGGTYIYMAFAEFPFKFSLAR